MLRIHKFDPLLGVSPLVRWHSNICSSFIQPWTSFSDIQPSIGRPVDAVWMNSNNVTHQLIEPYANISISCCSFGLHFEFLRFIRREFVSNISWTKEIITKKNSNRNQVPSPSEIRLKISIWRLEKKFNKTSPAVEKFLAREVCNQID